jgi:hypothetical protein
MQKTTRYMFMSCHQTTGHSYCIKVTNTPFQNVITSKYSGSMVTDQNCIYIEIKSGLNSGIIVIT